MNPDTNKIPLSLTNRAALATAGTGLITTTTTRPMIEDQLQSILIQQAQRQLARSFQVLTSPFASTLTPESTGARRRLPICSSSATPPIDAHRITASNEFQDSNRAMFWTYAPFSVRPVDIMMHPLLDFKNFSTERPMTTSNVPIQQRLAHFVEKEREIKRQRHRLLLNRTRSTMVRKSPGEARRVKDQTTHGNTGDTVKVDDKDHHEDEEYVENTIPLSVEISKPEYQSSNHQQAKRKCATFPLPPLTNEQHNQRREKAGRISLHSYRSLWSSLGGYKNRSLFQKIVQNGKVPIHQTNTDNKGSRDDQRQL